MQPGHEPLQIRPVCQGHRQLKPLGRAGRHGHQSDTLTQLLPTLQLRIPQLMLVLQLRNIQRLFQHATADAAQQIVIDQRRGQRNRALPRKAHGH